MPDSIICSDFYSHVPYFTWDIFSGWGPSFPPFPFSFSWCLPSFSVPNQYFSFYLLSSWDILPNDNSVPLQRTFSWLEPTNIIFISTLVKLNWLHEPSLLITQLICPFPPTTLHSLPKVILICFLLFLLFEKFP